MNMRVIILSLLVFFAAFLRFYHISVNPPSLTWDEAAWGYNAYTLGIDGKDEFGKFLPVDFLESFGDFKPPVYAYAALLPVKIFGLNEFSTRFPSAFFGTLTVWITYFLVKEIFFESKRKFHYALWTVFLLTISPWHINLSRAAFEANVASFFLIVGVWQFILGVRKKDATFASKAARDKLMCQGEIVRRKTVHNA
jgi:4-amino-4-deoxy-L-arabinose transferase-like glycosyltransferase